MISMRLCLDAEHLHVLMGCVAMHNVSLPCWLKCHMDDMTGRLNTCGILLDHVHISIIFKGSVKSNDVFMIKP